MKRILYLVPFMLFAACGNNTGQSGHSGKGPAAKNSVPVPLSAFEVTDEKGVAGIKVAADGQISLQSEVAGSIDNAGTVKDKEGKVLAHLNQQGMLVDANEKTLIKVDEEGTLDNNSGMRISWSPEGKLMRGTEDAGMRLSPGNSNARRAASIVLFLYFSITPPMS